MKEEGEQERTDRAITISGVIVLESGTAWVNRTRRSIEVDRSSASPVSRTHRAGAETPSEAHSLGRVRVADASRAAGISGDRGTIRTTTP